MSDRSREYGEGREPIPAIEEPTILFMINRSLRQASPTAADIYESTRCSWKIGSQARERAVYALGVSHGVVRGAYRIDRWYAAPEGRWCFEGRIAAELNVVGTSVARIKPRKGASSPVRLFLGGVPAPSQVDYKGQF